jgi:prepilin-type N-terminal cleavage/methylation domain-containing protein
MCSKAGFSLVETMLAILILGVGVAGLTQGITESLRASKESELQTKAALFAAGQIETLRAESFIVEGDTEGACGSGLENHEWKQSIKPGSIKGLFDVKVVVQQSATAQEVYSLDTLLFDPPLSTTEDDNKTKKPLDRKPRK